MGWLKGVFGSAGGTNGTGRARVKPAPKKASLYRLETLESRILLSVDPLQVAGVLVADTILPAAQVLILENPNQSSSPVIDWGTTGQFGSSPLPPQSPEPVAQDDANRTSVPAVVAEAGQALTG